MTENEILLGVAKAIGLLVAIVVGVGVPVTYWLAQWMEGTTEREFKI